MDRDRTLVVLPRLWKLMPVFTLLLCWCVLQLLGIRPWLAGTTAVLTSLLVWGLSNPMRVCLMADRFGLKDIRGGLRALIEVPMYGPLFDCAIGETPLGTPFRLNPRGPHVLIGASTGSGKSALMRLLIHGYQRSRACGAIYLIDLKRGVEFSSFRQGRKVKQVGTTLADTLQILQEVKRIAAGRLDYLSEIGETDWLKVNVSDLLMVVIDELSELTRDKDARELLEWLVNKSRAAGVRVVCASQVGTVDVIPSQIRQGFETRVLFRVGTVDQARAILGWISDDARFDPRRIRRGHVVIRLERAFHRVAVSRIPSRPLVVRHDPNEQ